MNQQEENHQDAYTSRSVNTVHKKHANPTDERSSRCSLPIEVVERRTKVGCRANFQEETREIRHEESHQVGHGNKRRNAIDVEEHCDLGKYKSYDDGIYGIVGFLRALGEDSYARQEAISRNGLKEFSRSNHTHQGGKETGCEFS